MKILHIIASVNPAGGGPIEGIQQLARANRQFNQDIEILSLDDPSEEFVKNFPLRVHAVGRGKLTYRYNPKLVEWLRENHHRYDVAIINGLWQYHSFGSWRVLHDTSLPYVVYTHGMLDPWFKEAYPLKHLKKLIYWHFFLQKILKRASTVFFTCEEEKLLARESFPSYRVHETVVQYGSYGPDCDAASASEEFLSRWPHLRGKRIAVTLGRIHPKKATDILLKSFAGSLAHDSNWHLVIAGPDQVGWQSDLEKLAMKLNMADRVTWTGLLKGPVKWGAFFASEVFVLPSHQENFGIVVAEAMACELPVIISDKINIWREIDGYGAGIVGSDTVEGTIASLKHWSALSAEDRARFRSNSRRCFEEQFDYQQTSRTILESIEILFRQNAAHLGPLTAAESEVHVPSNI